MRRALQEPLGHLRDDGKIENACGDIAEHIGVALLQQANLDRHVSVPGENGKDGVTGRRFYRFEARMIENDAPAVASPNTMPSNLCGQVAQRFSRSLA